MTQVARERYDDSAEQDALKRVDPDVNLIVGCEAMRQEQKLVMIPSESIAPNAVREVLGSVFTNIYAEGYPSLRMSHEEENAISRLDEQLALHRRYADRRFYKGTEFADLVEALAQRRVARLFATSTVPANSIFANVQALSGAAANNAVYEALLQPGDTIMGLALSNGGHLTHGSPFNRSGRHYHVVPYYVDSATGRLDYEAIRMLAVEHRPKLIVAGASAYPWDIDWARLRSIADELEGTTLMADIAHPAGLVVAGLFPNPLGHAHVVTFTTHKTLCGPRGAVILTTDETLAGQIDRSVFPGEQGGPHVNNIAAMAVAFHIAATPAFRKLQQGIVANAQILAATLRHEGLDLVYGGTNTHMLLVDLKGLATPTGVQLEGDTASRVLDVGGIVCNKNSIAGDLSGARATGLRFGTVWATQRGMAEADMKMLGQLIAKAIVSIVPFQYYGQNGPLVRGKIPFAELEQLRAGVHNLLNRETAAANLVSRQTIKTIEVCGPRAKLLLQEAIAANIFDLAFRQRRRTVVLDQNGSTVAEIDVERLADDRWGRERYALHVPAIDEQRLREWLGALSDGYAIFDQDDLLAKVEGPVVLAEIPEATQEVLKASAPQIDLAKPYFVGQRFLAHGKPDAKPEFRPTVYEGPPRQGQLYDEHARLNDGKGMAAFGGWTMPVWYSSIREEHRAVRQTAAIFDVTHMGVLEVRGRGAERFLDLVTTNYVPLLGHGQSQYSFFLDPYGAVLDDCLIYRRADDRFMVVVNAANAEKIDSWLRAVNLRSCLIDPDRPGVVVDATAEIVDLRDPKLGPEAKVDIALQGPGSLAMLQRLAGDETLRRSMVDLRKGQFIEGEMDGIPTLISRTGYTGEPLGFELYIPPTAVVSVWRRMLEIGQAYGALPAGLGARDAARTEAGFPLYGHELAGPYNISPFGAGYGQFVKLHKPFFVGRQQLIAGEQKRQSEVVRFRLDRKGTRVVRHGDPLVDQNGECLGYVTSSVVADGAQIGMAYVLRGRIVHGDEVYIFPTSRFKSTVPPGPDLPPGALTLLPEGGKVISRFR